MLERTALNEHTRSESSVIRPRQRRSRLRRLGVIIGAGLLTLAVTAPSASAATNVLAQQTNSSADLIGKIASAAAVTTLAAAALVGGVLWRRRPRPKPPVYEDYGIDDFDDENPGLISYARPQPAYEDLWREEATVPSPQRRWLE